MFLSRYLTEYKTGSGPFSVGMVISHLEAANWWDNVLRSFGSGMAWTKGQSLAGLGMQGLWDMDVQEVLGNEYKWRFGGG